ncbi:hypothetical protein B0H14DRAFT_3735217 [Mycena olivaceomarginata]|nr:hypothetical protein B0H14DRAFT_3735217 [Mycena olivaceomarginata]
MSLGQHMIGKGCKGVPVDWDGNEFWETYPFQRHSPSSKRRPNYSFVNFSPIKIRSNNCLGGVLSIDGILPCKQCLDSRLDVSILRERASRPFHQVHAEGDMNSVQLRAKLAATKDDVNTHKLKNLNVTESLEYTREQLSEYKEVFDFIGRNTVPALHRIFSNASSDRWSIKKIRDRVQLAAAGKYTARNYSQYEIALTIALYELGGGGTVYAMNHSWFALPSLKTIQPYRRQHRITPSVNGLNFTEISDNISALFGPRVRFDDGSEAVANAPPSLCGHTMSFDELALEKHVDYMTSTDEMGGFLL